MTSEVFSASLLLKVASSIQHVTVPMAKLQADLKVLMYLHTQGRFMFLIPWTSRNKSWMRVLGIIIACALAPIAYKLLTLRLYYFTRLPITCLVMDMSNFLTSYIFLSYFCIKQNRYINNWLKIQTLLLRTEVLLTTINFSLRSYIFFPKFALLHILFFIIHSSQLLYWYLSNEMNLALSYIMFRVIHYWTSFATIVILEWLEVLRRRYDHVNKYIKQLLLSRIGVVHQICHQLRIVTEIYSNLDEIIHELNTVFSYHLFFLIITSILMTLHGLSFAMVMFYTLGSSVTALAYVSAFFANILVLVLGYERLRKKIQNNIKTCLMLQEELAQGQLRREIGFMIKIMKKFQPKMSAIGFFEMDFQLISGYVSIVFTYLIIILQFNLTFK
ncbi:uncharacterized protein [Euwallacea fornicatus]|uniref:uncharacterized protein n=1 Tax=Euwallacea fornicatus TaxID=995702 RepID=UPI00338F2D7F